MHSYSVAPIFWCAAASIVFALSGCMGDPPSPGGERLAVVPVSGKVTINGAPAPKGPIRVMMVPMGNQLETNKGQEPAAMPSAFAWTDGTYHITTYASKDGAPPGEYRLVFNVPIFSLTRGYDFTSDQLGGEYTDPEKSEYTVTVDQTPVVIPPIDLKTDKDLNSFLPAPGYNQ